MVCLPQLPQVLRLAQKLYTKLGDQPELAGSARQLDTVSFNMSNWTLREDQQLPLAGAWCDNNHGKCTDEGFTYPMTAKVYSEDASMVLGEVTQEVFVPWRPAGDSTCAPTANGPSSNREHGWKVGEQCIDESGISFIASFDFSDQKLIVPDKAVYSISYNTRVAGSQPTGVQSPIDKVNVSLNGNTANAAVGRDLSTGHMYANYNSGSFVALGWGTGYNLGLRVTATTDAAAPTVRVNLNRESFVNTGAYVNQSRNPEIQAADENGLDRIEVYKEGVATPVNAWNNLGGVKERRANIRFLADGKYTIVTHDISGNASKPFTINLDKTDPLTTLVTPVGLAGNTFTVSGEASDNMALNRVYVQLIHRETNKRYAGTTINLIPQGAGPYTWERTFDATELNLPEGTYSAHVSVTDRAGNTSSAGWSDNFTLDKVKPVIKVNLDRDRYINSGDTTGKVQNPEIEAQDARLDRIELWKDGTPTGNVWTTDNTTRRAKIGFLGEGTYVIKAFDKAGNQSDEFEVKVDNTAPVVGSIDQTATQNSITISGTTDELGSPVSITLNGEEKSVMPDEEGAWIVTFKGLTPGTVYPYVVRSADAVGNEYASPESGDDMLQAETAPLVVIPGQGAGGSPTAPTAPRDDSAVGQPTVTVMSTPGSITPLGASASAFTFPAMMAGPVTDSAVLSEQDVLGTTDTAAPAATADDEADSDEDTEESNGMAWYWWLLIALAGIGAAWWILAALRKQIGEDE